MSGEATMLHYISAILLINLDTATQDKIKILRYLDFWLLKICLYQN